MATTTITDTSRVLLRQTIIVSIGDWLTKLLYIGFNVVIVRWLGEAALGEYATILAFVGLFGLLFNFGMTQHMERAIVRHPQDVATLFWNLVVLRSGLAIGGVAAICVSAMILGFQRHILVGVLVYAITYTIAAGQIPLSSVLKANNHFESVTWIAVGSRIASMVAGMILLWVGMGIFALLAASYVMVVVQTLWSVWAVRSNAIDLTRQRVEPTSWPLMIRTGIPFGLIALGLTLNGNVVTIVLAMTNDASTTGWYNAAYRLVFHAVGVLGGFIVVMMPSLTRVSRRDPDQVIRWTTSTIEWLAMISLPIAMGLSILAPRIISLLYGPEYASASSVLRIVAWDIPLMLGIAFFANVCAAVGFEHHAARLYLAGLALNLSLALALIPTTGPNGAASVNVIVDILGVVAFVVALRRLIGIQFNPGVMARTLLATFWLGLVVWLVQPLPLAVIVATGLIAYSAALLSLGLVGREMLTTAIRGRTGLQT